MVCYSIIYYRIYKYLRYGNNVNNINPLINILPVFNSNIGVSELCESSCSLSCKDRHNIKTKYVEVFTHVVCIEIGLNKGINCR